MTIVEMHYQFLLAKDAVDALSRHTFTPAQIDWLLNDAQLRVVRNKISGENDKIVGYEQTQKLTDEFSTLHIKYPLQPDLPLINHNGVYELSLDSLLYKYLRLLNAKVRAKDCRDYIPLKFTQSDDYNIAERDPFNNASREFIPYNIGKSSNGLSSSIYMYPNTLEPIEIRLEYLKYPNTMNIGTYTYIDGIAYPETSSELPEEIHHKIVDKAVELASVYIMDPSSPAFNALAYRFDS